MTLELQDGKVELNKVAHDFHPWRLPAHPENSLGISCTSALQFIYAPINELAYQDGRYGCSSLINLTISMLHH